MYVYLCIIIKQTIQYDIQLLSSPPMKKSHQVLLLLLIIFGACNTILLSLQNKQKIPQAAPNIKFFHPFMQLVVMFLAEALCFIPYLVYKLIRPKKNFLQQSGFMKMECPIYLPAIPGIMDLLSSGLAYISLNLIAGSVWQISRGGVIITTAIFSRLCLSKKLTNSAILGCSLAFIGITLVQIFQITLTDQSSDTHDHSATEQLIGVILLLVSLIFNTIALITEKLIFNKYTIHPLKMVYLQGIYGFICVWLIIIPLSFITCPDVGTIKQKCLYYNENYYIENVPVFFQQISKNLTLLTFIIALLFSLGISVPIAVAISKVINPISRSLADVCRTVLIWGFCLVLTATYGDKHEEYRLQKLGWTLNLLKSIGFVLVVVGTLIYHDIIRVFKDKPQDIKQSLLLSQQAEQNVQKYNQSSNSGLGNRSTASLGSGSASSSPGKKSGSAGVKQRESLM